MLDNWFANEELLLLIQPVSEGMIECAAIQNG
jgi:hypothetical protein